MGCSHIETREDLIPSYYLKATLLNEVLRKGSCTDDVTPQDILNLFDRLVGYLEKEYLPILGLLNTNILAGSKHNISDSCLAASLPSSGSADNSMDVHQNTMMI